MNVTKEIEGPPKDRKRKERSGGKGETAYNLVGIGADGTLPEDGARVIFLQGLFQSFNLFAQAFLQSGLLLIRRGRRKKKKKARKGRKEQERKEDKEKLPW